MDLIVHTGPSREAVCLFPNLRRENSGSCSGVAGGRFRCEAGSSREVYAGARGSRRGGRVFAVSAVETLFRSEDGVRDLDRLRAGRSGNRRDSLPITEEIENTIHLRSLVKSRKYDESLRFLKNVVSRGNVPPAFLCTSLIRRLCEIGQTRKARRVFDIIEDAGVVPDVRAYNVLVDGYRKNGEIDNALQLFDQMKVAPNIYTYNTILHCYCSMSRWRHVEKLLNEMIHRGCSPTVITFNILISFLCRQGLVDEAIETLEKMPEFGCTPDSGSYNPLLHRLCKSKKLGKAIEYVEVMVARGCDPDIVTYNTLLTALTRDGKVDTAVEMLNQLSSKGCSPTMITYNIVINGLSRVGKTDQAVELWHEMRGKGIKPSTLTYCSLIKGFCREGRVDEAINFFQHLEHTRVGSTSAIYHTVISWLCKAKMTDCAIDFLASMVSWGYKPNESTYTTLLEAIASEGFLEDASALLNELCARGVISKTSAEKVAIKI